MIKLFYVIPEPVPNSFQQSQESVSSIYEMLIAEVNIKRNFF